MPALTGKAFPLNAGFVGIVDANQILGGGASGVAPTAALGSGVADNTKFLRGDSSWQVPAGGGMVYPGAGIALSTGSAWDTPITNNSGNWNTAFGWGNHASAGYLTTVDISANTNLGVTAPVVLTGDTLSITQAATAANGYLSSTDWNTFNNKQPAGAYLTGVTADSPLSGSGTSGSHLVVDLSSRQPIDADLTAIAALGFTATAFLKKTAADTWALDTNTYLTAEADTLATVTARGATTSTASTFSGGLVASNATTALTLGSGAAGVDYRILFDGETNDGVLTWMEDEDYFAFSDDILLNTTERLYFTDANGYVYATSSGNVVLAGATTTTIGVAGNVTLGDSSLRAILPNVDEKIDIGSATFGIHDIFMGGNLTIKSGNIITDTSTGMMIGTGNTQLMAFWGASPIDRPGATEDLRQALIDMGLYTTGGATPLNLNGGAITATGNNTFGQVTISDTKNFIFSTGTGTKFGTGATQKMSWWNATPVVQSTGWAMTNVTSDKVLDANSTTIDELADVVGTLIDQLKTYGILGA